MVMRSKVKINSLFQYFYLTQQVSTIKISLPVFDLVNTFVEIALKPFYENQFQIKEENEMLINLRDTLLPKLISGELEVAEILVEDKNKYKNE
jgi:type I restriction enzyme, S subunit